jgi:hypothetical protein
MSWQLASAESVIITTPSSWNGSPALRVGASAAERLHQFKRLFEESMVALGAIAADFHRKAGH